MVRPDYVCINVAHSIQPVVDRLVLIYPSTETLRHTFCLAMKEPPTLSEPDLLDSLLRSPNTCDRCLKPHFKHAAIPDATFTILTSCPHNPDPEYPDFRNKAVAKILPDNRQHQACMGHLLVFKHALVDDANLSNAHLPVIDVAPSDLPYLDELVSRWVVHVHGLSASGGATSIYTLSISFGFPIAIVVSKQLLTSDWLGEFRSPFPPPPMAILDNATAPLPVYDIDEIFATLTLEERASPTRRRRRRSRPPAPVTPPPDYEDIASRRSPPRTPTARPPPSSSSSPPPSSSPTVYKVSSPAQTGYLADWSEAANLTRASPHTTVRAVRKTPAKRRSKKAAYVVFRGRSIGVFLTWEEVSRATSGVRFALQQGYTTVDDAQVAFDTAVSKGWTCASDFWRATPVLPSQAPAPLTTDPAMDADTRSRRRSVEAHSWYVVYAGVNPGVFATSLECALNVLGIESSLHESTPTYADAVAKFQRATARGEVRVCRARVA
ncbi:hypothetical protein C8F04DRAFT_1279936 [Mycena alexandri]|uniref:Ribonuclease H1 N-terminal domain-containing protein n=1 Tax=Mycena alexandri TaxID=1745969 RepID=A0AAD6RYV8_9AGAR|nr:hypothetical protein C8F04DRAFT_1279936 [Mycena alexandri]